jgi:serine/threonine protein kinase
VHRDVKPGNVLDAGVGTWKVADFGIAKWVHADETLTGTGELLGSPSYLAPERIEGQQAGPASDLYAVGVLLYEALCGRKPFEGDDPFALATAIRDGAFEPPGSVLPDADPGIVAVIERAMRHDPAERYESAEAMAEALLAENAQRTDDATATIAASVTTPLPRTDNEPKASFQPDLDATARVRVPRMEQTALLPVQEPAARPVRPFRPSKIVLIIAAAILAVAMITVLALAAFTGPAAPGASGPGSSSLPAPLDDALNRLEESVQP